MSKQGTNSGGHGQDDPSGHDLNNNSGASANRGPGSVNSGDHGGHGGGAETLTGTASADQLRGGDGADSLSGADGDDQLYAGYARQFRPETSWEVGVTGSDITEYYRPSYRMRYAELYGGVTSRHLSAHLYYSPDYLGEGVRTAYASLDATTNRGPDLRLFAHAGALVPLHGPADSEIRNTQYDLSAGAGLRVRAIDLKATLTTFGPGADYPAGHRQPRTAVVVSAGYAF